MSNARMRGTMKRATLPRPISPTVFPGQPTPISDSVCSCLKCPARVKRSASTMVGEANQHPHRQIGGGKADAAAHRDAGALAFEFGRVGGDDGNLAGSGRRQVDI